MFACYSFRNTRIYTKVMLRSEILSGICAKLRTVAASNNKVHMPWSLYYWLFAPNICMVLYFTHIPFVVTHTINASPPERLQQSTSVNIIFKISRCVTTSPVVLRWMCESPRTGCSWRTTPYIYVARTSNNRVIVVWKLCWY